ncbi:hypothetical protein [Chitinophaga sp. 22620]|uniref:hypothetical protein n=1 Tax=Chitinophaga sp. 22620 TaxID=3453952 RepID=UPI003F878FA4
MKKSSVLFLLLNIAVHGFSQYKNSLPHVNPVKPDAAALFKPVEHPIGTFSGTVPVEVPIATLEENAVQIPVSINYSTGGIKVEEIAGSVGLGWSLNAGGSITRVLNSVADDDALGMLGATRNLSELLATLTANDATDIAEGLIDSQPDIYYFNINGRSGKFYFNEKDSVVLVKQEPLDIQPIYLDPARKNTIRGWVIKDETGNKYYLGLNKAATDSARDYSTTSFMNQTGLNNIPDTKSYCSGWQLLEITDMSDVSLARFEYINSYPEFTSRSIDYTPVFVVAAGQCVESDIEPDVAYSTTSVQEKFLHKIITNKGIIEFQSSTGRKDSPGARRIDAILVKDYNNTLRKKFAFSYGYFSDPFAPEGPLYDPFHKRLKLNYIAEYGSNNDDSLVHSFQYHEGVNLPSRNSTAMDYWGYFNGKTSNLSTIPNGRYTRYGTTIEVTDGGDRRVDSIFSKANSLYKINFPTGGYREFIYEGNQALQTIWTQLATNPDYFVPHFFETLEFPGQNSSEPRYQHSFSVNSTSGAATFNYSITTMDVWGDFSVKIVKFTGPSDPGANFKVFTNEDIGTVSLPNGNYRFEIYYSDSRTVFTYAEGNWLEEQMPSETLVRYNEDFYKANMLAGGIRIKEIRDYDPVSQKKLVTKYSYQIPGMPGFSSGLLITPPIFLFQGTCRKAQGCDYSRLASSTCYPLSSEGNVYVYYPEVRTIQENNGYTDREFSFDFDLFTYEADEISQTTPPVVPRYDRSWKRGKLLLEKQYNQDSVLQNYKMVLYPNLFPVDGPEHLGDINAKEQRAFKVARFNRTGVSTEMCMNVYTLGSFFAEPLVVLNTSYTSTGTIENRTEYEYYISQNRPVLKKEKLFINDGKVKETEYRYVFNNTSDFYFGLSSEEQAMKTNLLLKNYLQPIETVVFSKAGEIRTMVSGGKYIFKLFSGQQVRLGAYRNYTTSTVYDESIFANYDEVGNLQEQYKQNNAKEAYIWGYNRRYPVAKIAGSDFASAVQLLDLAVLNNSNSTEAQIRTELNKLRVGLPNAMVTTFTYLSGLGVSSVTAPNGVTEFYEYDSFGRLKVIKDRDGKILKVMRYKYKEVVSN